MSYNFQIKKVLPDCALPKSLGTAQGRTKGLLVGVLRDLRALVSREYVGKSSLVMFVFFANMAA